MTVWEVGMLLNWALLVLLAFAMSGLMRQITELRAQLQRGSAGLVSEVPATVSDRVLEVLADGGESPHLVLLSDPHCLSCQQLKTWLSELPESRRRRFLVIEREAGSMPNPLPEYRLVRDNGLFQELDQGITPLLVVADQDGRIGSARPVAGPDELEQAERAVLEFADQRQPIRSQP